MKGTTNGSFRSAFATIRVRIRSWFDLARITRLAHQYSDVDTRAGLVLRVMDAQTLALHELAGHLRHLHQLEVH